MKKYSNLKWRIPCGIRQCFSNKKKKKKKASQIVNTVILYNSQCTDKITIFIYLKIDVLFLRF